MPFTLFCTGVFDLSVFFEYSMEIASRDPDAAVLDREDHRVIRSLAHSREFPLGR